MYITWLGHSAFRLQDKIGSDGVSVITDPFDPAYTGLKWSAIEADITTISHDHKDHSYVKGVKGDPFVIDCPGEYEYKGVYIEGLEAYHDNEKGAQRGKSIIYRIQMDGLIVTHLGDLGETLDAKQVEQLEGTDILLVPVGGHYTLDAKKAVEVINQLEPRIVIPMHYKLDGLKIEAAEVEKFIKEIGLPARREDKLKISKKDLPVEETELIILNY